MTSPKTAAPTKPAIIGIISTPAANITVPITACAPYSLACSLNGCQSPVSRPTTNDSNTLLRKSAAIKPAPTFPPINPSFRYFPKLFAISGLSLICPSSNWSIFVLIACSPASRTISIPPFTTFIDLSKALTNGRRSTSTYPPCPNLPKFVLTFSDSAVP